jgi:hypothetical protein
MMQFRHTCHDSPTMASGGEVPTAASTEQQPQPANRTDILDGGGIWRSLITAAPSSTFTVVVLIVVVLCRGVQWGAAVTLDATEG